MLLRLSILHVAENIRGLGAGLEVGEQQLLLLLWRQASVAQSKVAEVLGQRGVLPKEASTETLLTRWCNRMLVEMVGACLRAVFGLASKL